jgi:plastocyanin
MRISFVRSSGFFLAALFAGALSASAQTGTIKGIVHLAGAPPGNLIIRMGVDPKCAQINAGKKVIQEIISADEKGNLANVFVRLQGNFAPTPVPQQPVIIDQRSCVYTPRVVGMRVGQVMQVRNGDDVAHDVHGVSAAGNDFNVTTASGGAPFSFQPKREEVMLRIICDIHRWMVTYVGVVANPYFAVSQRGGAFQIDKVPAGTYAIEAWQERYGVLKKTVRVTAAETATVDFTYSGEKNP